jgi:hypothetical protein
MNEASLIIEAVKVAYLISYLERSVLYIGHGGFFIFHRTKVNLCLPLTAFSKLIGWREIEKRASYNISYYLSLTADSISKL